MSVTDRKKALAFYKLALNYPQGSSTSQNFFDQSIKADPTFSFAYFEKSVPFNKRGDYHSGFSLLNKAVELNPKRHLGYRGWLKLVKVKDYQGALKDFKILQGINPNIKNVWSHNINYLKGICFMGVNDYDRALIEFNKAKNVNSYLFKGIIYYRLGVYDKAIRDLKICSELSPKCTEAYYFIGQIYFDLKEKKLSEINLKKALILYGKGFINKNAYNEFHEELYFF